MSKQSEELKAFFERNGITQKEVSQATGSSKTTISNMLAGRFGISKKMAHTLASIYGFDVVFLLSGEGSLIPASNIRINQTHNHNTGDGAGCIHLGTDAALQAEVAQLREQLQREREEKARLLSIIESMTGK